MLRLAFHYNLLLNREKTPYKSDGNRLFWLHVLNMKIIYQFIQLIIVEPFYKVKISFSSLDQSQCVLDTIENLNQIYLFEIIGKFT